MNHRILKLAVAVFLFAAAAGCGAPVPGTPTAGELDVRRLNVGNFPTEPIDSTHQYVYDYTEGKALAAARLANHMITGLDVDPHLEFGSGALELTSADDFGNWDDVLSTPSVKAAMANMALFGFSSGSIDTAPNITFTNAPLS